MTPIEYCPHCKTNLRDEEIPKHQQEFFNDPESSPNDPDWVTHGSRKIGVAIRGLYDGILFWQCPDCAGTWQRWPEGSELADKAKPYID